MRIISSTLLAAQKRATGIPYIRVEVADRAAGTTRLSWSRLYAGGEPEFYHATTMPGDGSLIRSRVDPTSYQLYYQRVTSPGPGSNFSTWSAQGVVSSVSGIALCSRGSRVLLFYVGSDQRTIYVKESTDNGATFASAVAVVTAGSAVGWLAADLNSSNVIALVYSVGSDVYAIKRTGGVWGSPAIWSNSVSSVTGLACIYQGDWNVALVGRDSGNRYRVWTCAYGDGYSQSVGTWSTLGELTGAEASSGVEFHCPFLGYPDVFRLAFVEKYTGTSAYSRPFWSHSLGSADFISNLWREPVPFDLTSTYSLALAYSTAYAWLSTPSGVWQATLSPTPLDLSSDLLRLNLGIQPRYGKAELTLRNDDGRYATIGASAYAALQLGSEVSLSPGYVTSAGQEVSPGLAYWIDGWDYTSKSGEANFVLYCSDGWGLLENWKARHQYSWAAGSKNIFQLISFIFARAGLEFSSLSNSSAIVDQYPAFTIHPGESGAAAVSRLLDMVPDVLFFSGNYGYIKNPQSGDASVYSYGSDHPLREGNYHTSAQDINRVQVFGNGVLTESFNWTEILKVYDRLRQVYDLNLNTVDKAEGRGQAELREAAIGAVSGEILVPVNCGQEAYDVIDITDSRAGLSAAKRRVLGITMHYSARDGVYEQRLSLGGV